MASDQSRIRRGLSRRCRRAAAAFLGLAALCAGAAAEETPLTAESRTALSLTVYNQDLALVSETRQIGLPAGETLLAIEDVSDRLQPQSVLLDAAGVRLVEQSFAADLLTPERLLEASLGKTIRLIRSHPQTGKETVIEAEVLSLAGGIVLRIGEQIEVLSPREILGSENPQRRIAFVEIPPGLRSEPALLARLAVDNAGEQRVKLDYLTSGLSWQADYVARLNETEDRLDLTALVTLTNATRSDFEDAVLRLVAGEVNRVSPPVAPQLEQQRMMVAAPAMAADLAGPPQGASDRYVYQVTRPVTLLRGETKQIPLMSAAAVAVRREYRFDALVSGNPGVEEIGPLSARLDLELENGTDAGLGTPLPAGVVRIYGPGPGEQPLFLGEDRLVHTPEGEMARLTLGRAFDVTARAVRTVFERLSNRSYETGQRIVVKNAKAEAVEVLVGGVLPQGWSMLEESQPHEQESANRVVWRLRVPAKGESTISYRIRVSN